MGFFERRKKAKALATTKVRFAKDGMVKCYADMAVDQHMLGRGFVALHDQRIEMALRPGELPAAPSLHIYANPTRTDAPSLMVALLLVDGLHPSRNQAITMLNGLTTNLEGVTRSPEIAASLKEKGYVPALAFFDPKKNGDAAISIEELQPVVAS